MNFGLKLSVGIGFALSRVIAFPEQRDVAAAAGFNVPVDAVVAGVELATEIPGDFGLLVVVLPNGVPLFEPSDPLFGLLGPEPFGIADRAVINRAVFVE